MARPRKQPDPKLEALKSIGRLPAQDPAARETAKVIISKFHQRLGDNLLEAEQTLRELAFGIWVEEYVYEGQEVTRRVYQEKPNVAALKLYIELFTGEPKKVVENVHELGTGAQNTLADMIRARAGEAANYWEKQPEQKALPQPEPLLNNGRGVGDDPTYRNIDGEFVEIPDHEEVIKKLINGE